MALSMAERRALTSGRGVTCGECLCSCVTLLTFLVLLFGSLILFGTPNPDISFDVWVENGTLHAMDMDYSNSTLTYSLSAVFGFRNEDYHRDSDTVEKLAAAPLYGGQQLGPESSLTTFQLRFLETAMVPFDVRAQQAAGAVVARTYADDAARGYYTIQVKLSLRFGGLAWCDSTCTLYFFAPLPSPRGAPNIFDGDDCSTKCKTSVFHDTEQVGNATVASLSSEAASE